MKIYIVTHGAKNKGPNPGLTEEGKKQVQKLQELLPEEPAMVCIGEGRRHGDTAKELGFWGSEMQVSSVFGGCGSLESINGVRMLYLADGTLIPFEQCTSGEDNKPAVESKLKQLPNNTIICAGREILLALGVALDQAKSGCVYVINIDEDGKIHYISESADPMFGAIVKPDMRTIAKNV